MFSVEKGPSSEEQPEDNVNSEAGPEREQPAPESGEPEPPPLEVESSVEVEEKEFPEERERTLEQVDKELDDTRSRYVQARRLRRNIIRGGKLAQALGRTIEDEEGNTVDLGGNEGEETLVRFREQYESLLSERRKQSLKGYLENARSQGFSEEQIEQNLQGGILEMLRREDESLDQLATEREKGTGDRFKNWWRTHTGIRIAVGAGLLGAGILTGGAGFVAARSAWSGFGTFMGGEAAMERWSKRIGQKGIIDRIYGSAKKLQEGEREKKIGEEIHDLSEEEVQQEMARLRTLREVKGVTLEHAGRLGARTADIIRELQMREYKIAAQRFHRKVEVEKIDETQARAELFSEYLQNESERIDQAVDDAGDRERIKSIKRKAIAAAAGLTVGALIGNRAFTAGGEEQAAGAAEAVQEEFAEEQVQSLSSEPHIAQLVEEGPPPPGLEAELEVTPASREEFPELWKEFSPSGEAEMTYADWRLNLPKEPPENVGDILTHYEEMPGRAPMTYEDWRLNLPEKPPSDMQQWFGEMAEAEAPTGIGEAASYTETVEQGDSVWKVAERLLEKQYGSDFTELNEAQRTYVIDAIKDKVAAHPGQFGLENADRIVPGQKIDFSSVFGDVDSVKEVFQNAEGLSEKAMDAIVANNEQLAEWMQSHPGEALTSEKVQEILSGAYGEAAPGEIIEPPTGTTPAGTEYITEHSTEAPPPPEVVPEGGNVELEGRLARKISNLIEKFNLRSKLVFQEHTEVRDRIFSLPAHTAAESRKGLIRALENLPEIDHKEAKAMAKPLHDIFKRLPAEFVHGKTVLEVLERVVFKG